MASFSLVNSAISDLSIMEHNNHTPLSLKLTLLLVAVPLGAIVVAVYHCFTNGWCNHRRHSISSQQPSHALISFRQEQNQNQNQNRCCIENSTAALVPAHKHQKGTILGGEEDDGTCAVCLCEFEEGEELRTLPDCSHTFHVPCIDMWLHTHLTCPVCRADAISSKQILLQYLDLELEEESAPGHDSDVALSLGV